MPINQNLHDEWLSASNHYYIDKSDPRYPEKLRQLKGSPNYIYVSGCVDLLNDPQIAMVGSRNLTPYGRDNAIAFAEFFAQSGMIVTSGLALGIDAVAHQASLNAGGQTIAVLGCGLDQIYPKQNQQLAGDIEQSGCLVSEFPIGFPPRKEHFPQRNRLISGMSLGLLVVEAALRSGSLITARLAGEQGRDVFAIPGSIHNPMSRGCHELLRHGAKLVESAADILEELAPKIQHELDLEPVSHLNTAESRDTSAPLDPAYRALLEAIGDEITSVNKLVACLDLKPAEVASMLLMLELEGEIEAVTGGYQRNRGK